jgi:hypothetical protein
MLTRSVLICDNSDKRTRFIFRVLPLQCYEWRPNLQVLTIRLIILRTVFNLSHVYMFGLSAQLCLGQVYTKRNHQPLLFVPTCLQDGTFAPVQCHAETGYCWCVTPVGKPIPNSSVRNARPNCSRRGETWCNRQPKQEALNGNLSLHAALKLLVDARIAFVDGLI